MRRTLFVVALSLSLAAGLWVPRTEAAALGVSVSPPEMVASGQLEIDVAISGFEPGLHPTIEGTARIGSRVIEGPPGPAVVAHLRGVLDLPAGTMRLGGVGLFHFTPVPPLAQNTTVAVEVTVRQGGAAATARQTALLPLPTVIVPGYLNDLDVRPDPDIISVLEERGYRAGGPSPTAFWFTYPSRRFGLEDGAKALAAYVRQTVLASAYASRINVIGYSEGGLLARWNLAFDPAWAHLVNQFVMIGVPNQGTAATYVYAWYPALAGLAATQAARDMLPTYPFWRPVPAAPWTVPPDGQNTSLALLNARPLPEDVRIYAVYGSSARPTTWTGLTGSLPQAAFSYGPGDGFVLTASVLGLPIHGGQGIPGFADRLIQIDLGEVNHLALMRAAIPRIAEMLTERWDSVGIAP